MLNLKNARILLTGGHGFLGFHVYQELLAKGAKAGSILRSGKRDMDLRDLGNCKKIVKGRDLVIHLAANYDGLKYNTEHAGEVYYDNAAMGLHLAEAARQAGVKKFVMIGTVGSYPKDAVIPYKEENFWNGLPETGNDSYGLAKKFVAGALMAFRQQYGFLGINLVLANMYGPHDHFEINRANLIPAMINKFSQAKKQGTKEVVMWGSGKATREFLYVGDAARAIVKAARDYEGVDPVNIGSGKETKVREVVERIAEFIGYHGKIVWDKAKSEGQRRRFMDVSKAKKELGFTAKVSLSAGLKAAVEWFLSNAPT